MSSIDLMSWTKQYIQQKDLFKKEIVNISQEAPWDLIVTLKDGTKRLYKIEKECNADELLPLLGTDPVFLIVPNTKKNLDTLIQHWKAFKTYPKLCFIFVNPASTTETKWLLYPYTHDRVTETESLALGLKSLFETVEEIKN